MKKLLLISIAAAVAFGGESLLVGAGGGYKKPVTEVIENLKKDGVQIEGAFANLGQITIQAKEGCIRRRRGVFKENGSGHKRLRAHRQGRVSAGYAKRQADKRRQRAKKSRQNRDARRQKSDLRREDDGVFEKLGTRGRSSA